jgi:hypothetical protein
LLTNCFGFQFSQKVIANLYFSHFLEKRFRRRHRLQRIPKPPCSMVRNFPLLWMPCNEVLQKHSGFCSRYNFYGWVVLYLKGLPSCLNI